MSSNPSPLWNHMAQTHNLPLLESEEAKILSAAISTHDSMRRILMNKISSLRAELKGWREGGLTGEIIRRNGGSINVGHDCSIVAREPNTQKITIHGTVCGVSTFYPHPEILHGWKGEEVGRVFGEESKSVTFREQKTGDIIGPIPVDCVFQANQPVKITLEFESAESAVGNQQSTIPAQ